MLPCNTIAEWLQTADFCEEIVMSRSPPAINCAHGSHCSTQQSDDPPGD
jgi:hypothetical protein